jgi:hypothetical protein
MHEKDNHKAELSPLMLESLGDTRDLGEKAKSIIPYSFYKENIF